MDLSYPLTYAGGSVALIDTPTLSQTRHLLDTIAGERILSPSFGVPLDILYSTGIPQVLAERVRLTASQMVGITAIVEVIAYKNGELSLKLTLATGETVQANYATG
ncbi:MAG: hypothetical protein KME60_03150 [Cyanomargarita calcarea GSE-NOS-MK-12-04C]|uniref:Uncharacterized protein n=1 Tax=Cyanomargarita calcarea GSE-NOS-MK-12-04C TaxID=2839659 RepID=A0A951QI30_9CYAN|nr:hypothetical protein [Cyanomargarita calcarea GSE-NOS-MK-12-04C]